MIISGSLYDATALQNVSSYKALSHIMSKWLGVMYRRLKMPVTSSLCGWRVEQGSWEQHTREMNSKITFLDSIIRLLIQVYRYSVTSLNYNICEVSEWTINYQPSCHPHEMITIVLTITSCTLANRKSLATPRLAHAQWWCGQQYGAGRSVSEWMGEWVSCAEAVKWFDGPTSALFYLIELARCVT